MLSKPCKCLVKPTLSSYEKRTNTPNIHMSHDDFWAHDLVSLEKHETLESNSESKKGMQSSKVKHFLRSFYMKGVERSGKPRRLPTAYTTLHTHHTRFRGRLWWAPALATQMPHLHWRGERRSQSFWVNTHSVGRRSCKPVRCRQRASRKTILNMNLNMK